MKYDFNPKQGSIKYGSTFLDVFQLSDGSYRIWIGHLPEFLHLYENGQNCDLIDSLLLANDDEITFITLEGVDRLLETITIKLFTDILHAYAYSGNKWCNLLMQAMMAEALNIRAMKTK